MRPGDPGWEQAFRSGPVQLVNRPHGTLLTAANECSGHAGQTAVAVRLPIWHALRSILRPTCTDVRVSRCALTSILRRIPSERESNIPPHLATCARLHGQPAGLRDSARSTRHWMTNHDID